MGITRSPLPLNNGNLPLPFFVENYQRFAENWWRKLVPGNWHHDLLHNQTGTGTWYQVPVRSFILNWYMVPVLDHSCILKLVLVPILDNSCTFKLVLVPVLKISCIL